MLCSLLGADTSALKIDFNFLGDAYSLFGADVFVAWQGAVINIQREHFSSIHPVDTSATPGLEKDLYAQFCLSTHVFLRADC